MNIKEVAKMANVSVATVSRVINNNPKVKISTKEKINDIIKQFNYIPNSFAVKLSKRVSERVIGIIVPDVSNVFFSEMVDSISKRASEENFTLLLCNTEENPEKEKKFIELMLDYRVKGLIFIPSKNKSENIDFYIKEFKSQDIPIVLLDRELENLDLDGVFLNNFETSYLIASELFKKRDFVYYISGPLDIQSSVQRYLGFKKSVADFNISLGKYAEKIGDFKFQSGYELGTEILKKHKEEQLTVYLANNSMALGFLKAMKENRHGIKTITLAIFEISEILEILLDDENFITCQIPNKNMAKSAFEILLEKIEKNTSNDSGKKKIYFSPLVINKLK